MKNGQTLRLVFLLAGCAAQVAAAPPLALCPENPHYFCFLGRATVLVTSGEHYGSVINQDFNYIRYLDELARNHLNLTRIWMGPYREVAGDFAIGNNTLAPKPDRFVTPWPRSSLPGAADGGNRFDLARWNDAYFARLRDFMEQASQRNIVVEINLFCPYYEDSMWRVSPLNATNNVNEVGQVSRTDVLTLKNPALVSFEDAMVRKIVGELNSFDNLYYEICNEPYWGGVAMDWQRHISTVIASSEDALPNRHLISQNIANGSKIVTEPDPKVGLFNFHYSRPPESVEMNFGLNRAIGNNETGFDGQSDATYRIQGWDFLAAGGSLYNTLDYSFTVGHEEGGFRYSSETPGGGSFELRRQLRILKDFFDTLNLVKMHPVTGLVSFSDAEPASVRVLAEPGQSYVVYLHEGRVSQNSKPKYVVDSTTHRRKIQFELPSGSYETFWLDTKTGVNKDRKAFHHAGGKRVLKSAAYAEDTVLAIRRVAK